MAGGSWFILSCSVVGGLHRKEPQSQHGKATTTRCINLPATRDRKRLKSSIERKVINQGQIKGI